MLALVHVYALKVASNTSTTGVTYTPWSTINYLFTFLQNGALATRYWRLLIILNAVNCLRIWKPQNTDISVTKQMCLYVRAYLNRFR